MSPRENVQDYPRPPALEPVTEVLRVVLGGVEVAKTMEGYRVLETHHAPTYYFPPADILTGALVPASGRSFCEWKGWAVYFDVVGGGVTAAKGAWAYPDPSQRFHPIRDHLAFYAQWMEGCFVGSEPVRPQPGDFYGGWVTDNLEGNVKGGPGTLHW